MSAVKKGVHPRNHRPVSSPGSVGSMPRASAHWPFGGIADLPNATLDVIDGGGMPPHA
jgi:hypothetical protein